MTQLRVLRYAWDVGRMEFSDEWTWKTWATSWVIRIVGQATFFAMVGQLIGSPDRVQYLVIGNAVLAGVVALAITVPQSTWDRFDGTYPLLVIAPSGLLLSIMGRTAIRIANALASATLAFVALPPLFGVSMPWPESLLLLPLVTLTVLTSWFLFLFVGALANLAPQARNMMHNVVTFTTMAFCGVNVPVSFWPGWLQGVANCIPFTHGLEAVRLALAGGEASEILQKAVLAAVAGLVWLALAVLTVDRMANAGRANGSIDFVA